MKHQWLDYWLPAADNVLVLLSDLANRAEPSPVGMIRCTGCTAGFEGRTCLYLTRPLPWGDCPFQKGD